MSTDVPRDTPVILTIAATRATQSDSRRSTLYETPTKGMVSVPTGDPDVTVTVLEPERPTLEEVLAAHEPPDDFSAYMHCGCGKRFEQGGYGTHLEPWQAHVADELRSAGLVR